MDSIYVNGLLFDEFQVADFIESASKLKEAEKEIETLTNALKLLIEVKDHKDRKGKKNLWYKVAQPIAWNKAREALEVNNAK